MAQQQPPEKIMSDNPEAPSVTERQPESEDVSTASQEIEVPETPRQPDPADQRAFWNATRYQPGEPKGHYESWFLRANHPTRPLGFWIRYTIFSPKRRPIQAVGERWGMFFDGEAGTIHAVKDEVPMQRCEFSKEGLDIRIGQATLADGRLEGRAANGERSMSWALAYEGEGPPLLLMPEAMYEKRFPKAKALVSLPNARFQGAIQVDDREIPVEDWVGSQNHNWGKRHTDQYAWGQVASFDEAPGSFLEVSTGRVRIGPFWSPWYTLIVLEVEGQRYMLNSMRQARRADGRFTVADFEWTFDSEYQGTRVQGHISARADQFVGLRYRNPPGKDKICLNTKIARCELTLERPDKPPLELVSAHRAAFELLTDEGHPEVPIAA